MHFHLPKPLHGWREFAGEVGIIVIGVLIALAAEAAVEHIAWERKVSEARDGLRHELAENLSELEVRVKDAPCVSRRLDELDRIVTEASVSGRLPPVGLIGMPTIANWPDSVWQSQMAAQTAAHFPSRELQLIGDTYREIAILRQYSDREDAAWLTLRTMTGPGRPAGSSTIDRLSQALVEARRYNFEFPAISGLIKTVSKREHAGDFLTPDPQVKIIHYGPGNIICMPIGPVPAAYGAAYNAQPAGKH